MAMDDDDAIQKTECWLAFCVTVVQEEGDCFPLPLPPPPNSAASILIHINPVSAKNTAHVFGL